MYNQFVEFAQEIFSTKEFIPLHEPRFFGNEKKYLEDCIDSTFVSSVGKYVDRFELDLAQYTGAKRAVAVVNGTSALHTALVISGVCNGDEVITQPLTFVATCNAISFTGAKPIFVDVSSETMGMSPDSLLDFLENHTEQKNGKCLNKLTGNVVSACVPMHSFGFPCEIEKIVEICRERNIKVIEDAAESLGSYTNDVHTGLQGDVGVLSFNGNKTITSGGGGAMICNSDELADRAKHLTTTAKVSHKWKFEHDQIGFNYRMPNINAALACAQLESLPKLLKSKRTLGELYKSFFKEYDDISFIAEREGTKANYWLNVILLKNKKARDNFLNHTNEAGVMTRPSWELMSDLKIYSDCFSLATPMAKKLSQRLVNIPSSARWTDL